MDYVRKPYVVEVTEITKENIEGLADRIGVFKRKDDGKPYIETDKKKVPQTFPEIYPGAFMTMMGGKIRIYSKKSFHNLFVQKTAEMDPWIDYMLSSGREVVETNG